MRCFVVIQGAALLALGTTSFAEQLLAQGSFELPPVTRRKARAEGADVSKFVGGWVKFQDKADAEGGRIVAGLTNEVSRTGRQSLFVQFEGLTKPQARALLSSRLIPVLPGKPYSVGIWGRVDRANPLTLDQRLPYLKLRVDWFAGPGVEVPEEEDEDAPKAAAEKPAINVTPISGVPEEEEDLSPESLEQVGEPVLTMQPMPGSLNRPPVFKSGAWNQFGVTVKSPALAAFAKVTWTFESPPQVGETNGVMYFDDATLEGESGLPKEPSEGESEDASGAETPAQPAPPAAVRKPGGINLAPLSEEPGR